MSGARAVIEVLREHGVDLVFGYPGGAVLPIYDALFDAHDIRHILARHEQGAAHAAEGYARSSGKIGVVLVTSGPGVTNAVTGLTDALMDSIPLVCLGGQVATHLIGTDAFQECDAVGITRPCTKHNYAVRRSEDLVPMLRHAFKTAAEGRPGPVYVDIPKDLQFLEIDYPPRPEAPAAAVPARPLPADDLLRQAAAMIAHAQRPVFYTGGGVINSGPEASELLRRLAELADVPVTSTLMGLGAYPASGPLWLGMLGMHGTVQANLAMHECDVLVAIGARFDDRITGRIDAFSPNSKKIHIDIDPSSINKVIVADLPLLGDVAQVLRALLALAPAPAVDRSAWHAAIAERKARDCLAYTPSATVIKPQYALERLYAKTADRDTYITTEVGQHQMWAAQFYKFDRPNRWLTSGGLGTMGYGLPAAIGAQLAHPDKTVIDIAGEASILMNMQEMSTAAQYRLPVKVFILNNRYMGMVRQWQELLHGGRYSQSYSEALPDFVLLAEAYRGVGFRVSDPAQLDAAIDEMLAINDRPVLFDCCVDPGENCYPMIPSGKGHHEMILGPEQTRGAIDEAGKMLV